MEILSSKFQNSSIEYDNRGYISQITTVYIGVFRIFHAGTLTFFRQKLITLFSFSSHRPQYTGYRPKLTTFKSHILPRSLTV